MEILKGILFNGVFLIAASSLVGCAYGGAAGVGGNWVVITKNDGLLFGALRSVYVCKATQTGLSQCKSGETP